MTFKEGFKMYIVNLIRERTCESQLWIDTFIVDDSVKNPEQALRDAVKEFLATDEGKKANEYACNDFNWGDAVVYVPEEVWAKHGLKFRDMKSVDIKVYQDEVLCDPLTEEEE